ncbi:hypothetical protein OAL10_02565 [Gammaproteobacteria bacterium]|nr:hypothetical protein [Gammaproteobacteria bacterium]
MNLDEVAAQLLRDYDAKTPGTVFEHTTFTTPEAYEIQTRVSSLRQQRGESIIGYKVGCVSPALRESMGIFHPVFGRLYDTEQWQSDTRLEPANFSTPAVEGELAVHLKKNLSVNALSEPAILEAIDSVFVVIEMHNKVFRGPPSAPELIANNAIHAGVAHASSKATSLFKTPGPLSVIIDGEEVAKVDGQDLRVTIIDSLAWLAQELDTQNEALRAGHTVLCGTISGMHLIEPGAHVQVTTEDFGSVNMHFG